MNQVLEKMMKLELASLFWDEKYRDHFIHPFQDFLLGAVILDHYYEDLGAWYCQALNQNSETDTETCWLLATIFHDRARPLELVGETVTELFGPIRPKWRGWERTYASYLSSLHKHVRNGNGLELWNPPANPLGDNLASILLEQAKRQDHGVIGSFLLMDHARRARGSASAITGTETMAALAIALHNQQPRKDFLRHSILPAKMESFPIPALLLYCDAAQEWGRPFKSPTPQSYLVGLSCEQDRVLCEVSFPTARDAKNKLSEFAGVYKCVSSTRPKFFYSTRIYASR